MVKQQQLGTCKCFMVGVACFYEIYNGSLITRNKSELFVRLVLDFFTDSFLWLIYV